jgi:PIN domain nuclease of toxin-antitoxin system
MKLLLDTHSFLWFVNGDSSLSASARTAIELLDNQRFISIASVWEIAIKVSIGKLKLNQPFQTFIADTTYNNDMTILTIELAHTIEIIGLPFHHRDPFDRLLAAQARVEGMTLVSKDEVFDRYGCSRVW